MNTINNPNDNYGKGLLCLKSILAFLLKQIDPLFAQMSRKDIIKECLDPYNPNPYFMTPLSESDHEAHQNEFIKDRVFRIKLPKHSSKLEQDYGFIILDTEIQGYKPKTYSLENRAILYNAQQLVNENKIFGFKTTKETYLKTVPVWSIWLCFYPGIKSNSIDHFYLRKETLDGNRTNDYLPDKNYFPLLNTFIVNVTEEPVIMEDEIYTFTRDFSKNKTDKDSINFYNKYKLYEDLKGDPLMIYTEYERTLINKSKKEGRSEGIVECIKALDSKGFNPEFISNNLNVPLNEVLKALE